MYNKHFSYFTDNIGTNLSNRKMINFLSHKKFNNEA